MVDAPGTQHQFQIACMYFARLNFQSNRHKDMYSSSLYAAIIKAIVTDQAFRYYYLSQSNIQIY